MQVILAPGLANKFYLISIMDLPIHLGEEASFAAVKKINFGIPDDLYMCVL